MTLRWGTGADLMRTGNNENAQFAQLGWYGFPSDPAGSDVRVHAPGRFDYGNAIGMDNSSTSGGDSVQMSYLFKNGLEIEEFRIGAAMYVSTEEAYQKAFIGLGRTGDALVTLVTWTFGRVQLWLGRPITGTLLAETPPGTYFNDAWNYWELGGIFTDMATGYFTAKLNTVEIISVVATITQPDGFFANSFMIGYGAESSVGSGNTNTRWDDIYVGDTDGAENNDFLGNIRVQGLIPNAAGDSTMWTPFGAMTNWEAATNEDIDDTIYVFSPNVGDYDLYNVTPLINTPTVFGVQVTGYYRQDDATQRSVKNVIKSGTTEAEGVEYFTTANYTGWIDMWEEDPDTMDPWLYADVNNLQIGPKVES